MSMGKRYAIFIAAILIQSTGIAVVVKSLLGTSPISSLPYVLSLSTPYTLGEWTFTINMLLVLGQVAILRRDFERIQILQVPMTAIFSMGIDLSMYLWDWVRPEAYLMQLLMLLIGASCVSLGVALQGIANILMLPGEGIVYAIARHFHIDFGKVKTANDVTLVTLAAITSFTFLGTIQGIREGTLISALITGIIARFFLHHLGKYDGKGELVLSPHW